MMLLLTMNIYDSISPNSKIGYRSYNNLGDLIYKGLAT